jgi:hypothetical protein
MVEPSLPPHPLVEYWLQRHRSPISFILHMIGIPPTILGVQFAGHYLEGTDPGEIIYFKRKLGLPYVEFPPPRPSRYAHGRSA